MIKKIIYITRTRPEYSLNAVCIKGLRENGIDVLDFYVKDKGIRGFMEALSFYRNNSRNADLVMIGYNSPALVIFSRFFCRKKIVFNAVLSEYERMIISRRLASRFSLKAAYYWLLDLVAVHFADLTTVETNCQADFFKKMFRISGRKIYRNWIGVDESKFFYGQPRKKFDTFTVFFRGALMPEAGAKYVVRAAKLLEDKNIKFVMIGGGILSGKIKEIINDLKPKNFEYVEDYVPYEKLRDMMQECHLSLGQLSDHNRLGRTIPHKAYESLVMKLPYLTASNTGILELLTSNETCLTCSPANTESLADKILWARDNYHLVEKIAENGYKLHQEKLSSRVLAKNLLDRIATL
jgi:glycosyltransferase involved in cell wall biosynthesis